MTSMGIYPERLLKLNEMQIPFICKSQDESRLRFPLHLVVSSSHTLKNMCVGFVEGVCSAGMFC